MRKNKFNNRGVTLIELLIALTLVIVIISISFNLIVFGNKSHKLTSDRYELQSSFKRTAERTNDIIRYSKAVFAVPEIYIENENTMDPEWNYFMVSLDGKRIVNMIYDNDLMKHREEVLAGEQDNINYKLLFEKDPNQDTMMKYKIYAYSGNTEKLLYETDIEGTNTIQVVDKGTALSPAIALAYKGDGTATGEGIREVSYVTLILDISGSMNDAPDNGSPGWRNLGIFGIKTKDSYYLDSRINLLKTTLTKVDGIVDKFSKIDDIYISVVPFSTTANSPDPMGNIEADSIHDVKLVKEDKSEIVDKVKSLNALGGTNTGDGIRRAYHLHKNFRDHDYFKNPENALPSYTVVNHYTILLVDGVTTYETSYVNWNLTKDPNESFYINYNERVGIDRTQYDVFKLIPKERWFLNDGNIGLSSYNNYNQVFQGNVSDLKLDSYKRNDDIEYFSTYYNTIRTIRTNVARYKADKTTGFAVITGTGSTSINDSPYIKKIGEEIIKLKNTEDEITSYIIGYASETSKEIKYIGESIGTDIENNIFNYGQEDFNLDDIFETISNDILANKWLLTGPQIKK